MIPHFIFRVNLWKFVDWYLKNLSYLCTFVWNIQVDGDFHETASMSLTSILIVIINLY